MPNKNLLASFMIILTLFELNRKISIIQNLNAFDYYLNLVHLK